MNLCKVDSPEVEGWVLEDADGNIWTRPSRGTGPGSMSMWMTETGAQREADSLNKDGLYKSRGPWVTARAVVSIALVP